MLLVIYTESLRAILRGNNMPWEEEQKLAGVFDGIRKAEWVYKRRLGEINGR